MARSLIPVGTGEHRLTRVKRQLVDCVSSGTPFVTEIGIGKVIKGWDEGELRLNAILRVLYRCFFSRLAHGYRRDQA
jgi:hypothetical protein